MPSPDTTPTGTGLAGTYYFLDSLIAAEGRQYNGVRSGLQVTASGSPSLVLQVAAGELHRPSTPGVFYAYAGGTVTLSTADANYMRIDTISAYWDGASVVIVATPGPPENNSAPTPVPAPPIDDGVNYNVVLATVVVYPGATAVGYDLIYDRRFFLAHNLSGDALVLATSSVSGGAFVDQVAVYTSTGNITASGLDMHLIGDVVGNVAPVVDTQVVLYDGTTGKVIKNATATITSGGALILTGGIKCVLPTSAGATGTLWDDGGVVKVSP